MCFCGDETLAVFVGLRCLWVDSGHADTIAPDFFQTPTPYRRDGYEISRRTSVPNFWRKIFEFTLGMLP